MASHIKKWERAVTRTFLATIMVFVIIALIGCGDDDWYYDDCYECWHPTVGTMILSDPEFDGDISRDSGTGSYTIAQGNTQRVYVGIDPATGAESRAFMDFPLRNIDGIPVNASIVSATIDMVINNIVPQPLVGTIPIRIDLVSFQPPTLVGTDFDRTLQPALATTTITPPISQADFGNHIVVDVTSLLIEAQRLGLANFQIRILRELGPVSPGLIEINDTTGVNRMVLAPLLQVTYY
ncbi:MAG: hypothetical protein ABFD82_04695 [Syntrophaceae bacterium]